MSKKPFTVFEPVGFTEPVPGLRRRPAAARGRPMVEVVQLAESIEPRWSPTLPPEQAEARASSTSTRGRAAPLATGVVLLAMAGAGWAMLQVSSPPALEIPPLTELAMPAAPTVSATTSVAALPSETSSAPATAVEAAPLTKPVTPSAAATKTAALKPAKGDLLQNLPPPAAGPVAAPAPTLRELPPVPDAMPTSPLSVPASAPASAPADSKPESKPEIKPEAPPAVAPPQPPASAASSA